jgi:AbrB family looped-hinge helix DNA binding protein
MVHKEKNEGGVVVDEKSSCCRVESLISVDERGQMVLPKDIRERAGIGPGEKLAVVSWEHGGKVCCISLVKAAALTEMVQSLLGPMVEQLAASRSE